MKWKVNIIVSDEPLIYETEDHYRMLEYLKAAKLIGYKKIKVIGES